MGTAEKDQGRICGVGLDPVAEAVVADGLPVRLQAGEGAWHLLFVSGAGGKIAGDSLGGFADKFAEAASGRFF
ncbi:MAG: hypothetical protein NT087_05940 [Deltaproteobacteria bacterium]|nr:hypothetical protein [Deltaproteobacteria bacterium]